MHRPICRPTRHRLLTYLTAALLNLAIVSGTLPTPDGERVPIVRLQRRDRNAGRFHPGELTDDGAVVVRTHRANRFTLNAN